MKYIFLDIDGVFNHMDFYNEDIDALEYKKWREENPYPISEFDPVVVKRVNEVFDATGARFVLSSSWRHGDKNALINIFNRIGLKSDFDITPDFTFVQKEYCRGDEIKAFLDSKDDVESFCIVDDDDNMLEEQQVNFVHCDFMHGFTEKDKEKAIKILNKK